MNVRVKAFTLDINVEAWMANYGVDKSEVRADVQTYVENGIRDHLAALGLLIETGE